MSFLTKPIGLAVVALLVYILTLGALFMRSKDVLSAALNGPVAPPPTPEMAALEESNYVYWSFRTNEINKLIRDLKAERESLDRREEDVSAAEARVEAERKELERLRQDIENYRKELSTYLTEVKGDEAKNLRSEVAIINNMEPQNIVSLFSEKDDDDVVRLLALMKADAVAPVLERMMVSEGDAGKPSARRVATLLEKLQRLKVTENTGN